MPKKSSTRTSAPASSVAQFLDALDHPHADGIALLRRLILGVDARISEDIKWNAPSFKVDDHFATFKLHPPKHIQLVLHRGAKVKPDAKAFRVDDPDSLLKWPAPDRAVLTLASTAELKRHQDAVVRIVSQWVAQL